MLALTPISPFRPRRWRGALVPESTSIRFNVREAAKRPVSAVADQREIRDVKTVLVTTDRSRPLTLLFDPDQGLDERIAMEQFIV
jgi:NAD+ kinase